MSPHARALPVLVAALFAAAPAHAARVTVVDGDRAVVRNDPSVPTRAESDLGPPPPRSARATAKASASRGSRRPRARASSQRSRRADRRARRAVLRALARARRARRIGSRLYRSYRRTYLRARSVRRRLSRARARQLGYVIRVTERLALKRRLIPSRLRLVFLHLRRNTSYWRKLPFPASGDRVTFRGSEVLFQYFPGRGLQVHPLATFVKANALHGACVQPRDEPCERRRLKRVLDEMARLAPRRHRRFVAWEYMFSFGGGSPPWMSGMAQATGLQAFARGARLLGQPRYVRVGRKGLRAFSTRWPVGVKAVGFRGGRHYLHYSFAPGLYVFNAFTQAVIGLYDFAKLTGSGYANALYVKGESELRREIPYSDLGDWSRYSYRGRPSTRAYHELLREVLQSACNRRLGGDRFYCTYASRYRRYQ